MAECTHVLPPGLASEGYREVRDLDVTPGEAVLSAIAVCVIEYVDADGVISERPLSCRRYEDRGGSHLIGAVCLKSNRYKLFRCERILAVTDAITGEILGDGKFFDQFAVGIFSELADTWNTTSQRKSLIVAGLNVLAFMARCDGHWHALEKPIIEDFVCALWLRKEWEGEPPLERIVRHAQRLAPDGQVFEKAIRQCAHSRVSREVLHRFVHRMIAADGVICDAEHNWALRFDECLSEAVSAEAAARRA